MNDTVLILEPNPAAQAFLVRLIGACFSGLGAVEALREPAAALARLRGLDAQGQACRLFLVDLDLPGGQALEVIEAARGLAERIVVTTLNADEESLFAATRAGADGHLLKGSRQEVLVESLQRLVRGQVAMSPALARRILGHFTTPDAPGHETGRPEPGLDRPGPAGLSHQEAELLGLVSRGYTLKEIAVQTGVRPFAVADHLHSVCRKLSGRPARRAAPA